MIPHHFAGQDRVLEAPAGYDHENQGECGALPVAFVDGGCLSVWKPTPEELAMLNAGGGVTLWVSGPQPIVAMGTTPAASLIVAV